MNVLTVLCGGGWMPANLSEGWRRLGWTVCEFLYGTHMGKDWSPEGLSANRRVNRQLVDVATQLKREGKLDLIFAVIYDDVLEVETARRLRALDVPLVNYHVDLVGQWYRVLRTGPCFDRVACAQTDHWRALVRAGIRPFYMPMASNPPADDGARRSSFDGVVYMGSPWSYRRHVLRAVWTADVPLRIYGNNWTRGAPVPEGKPKDSSKQQPLRKNLHDARHYLLPLLREAGGAAVASSLAARLARHAPGGSDDVPAGVLMGAYSGDEFPAIVRGAAINLGFTHFAGRPGTPGERRQVRLRELEIPMAGGFFLTQDCAQLRELFDVGTHVASWNDEGELLDRVRYYLDRPHERHQVAAAGEAHCRARHTWARRFAGLLDELGIRTGRAEA